MIPLTTPIAKRLSFISVAFIAAVLMFNNPVLAEVVNKPTIEEYAALPSLQSVSVSPSGDMIAFVHSIDEKKIVKLYSLKKREMVAAFDAGDILPRYVYFIDDDRVVIRVEDSGRRLRGYQGIYDISNAFVYSIKKNSMRQLLTAGNVIYSGQTQLGDIVGLSEDGKYAYMPAWAPKRKGSDEIHFSLVRASLGQKKASPKVHESGDHDVIDYFMDGDKVIALESFSERKNRYRVEVPDGRGWRTIYETTEPLRPFSISGVTPDKKHLVLIATDAKTKRRTCFTMRLSDGEISTRLFAHKSKDIAEVITDINRVIYGVEYEGFSPSYAFFDEKVAKRVNEIQAFFEGQSVAIVSNSPDWKHVVVHVSGSLYSGNHYLFSEGKSPLSLAEQFEKFKGEFLHPIFEVAFRAKDNLVIPTLVTVPFNKRATLNNLPAVMMPHGGPESLDRIGFDWLAQALANEGYLVIQPQFRGSEGFGADHVLAGRGEWGGKMQSDLLAALDGLVADGVVDKNRVCIAGWSYGGYAALAGGAFDSEHYKCVVSVNGISDLPRMLKSEKREENRAYPVYDYWKEVIAKGDLDSDGLNAISPVKNAENYSAPVLLIYGEDDEVVLPEQSKRMYKALKKAGKDVEILEIEDEKHSFESVPNREKTLRAIIDFINENLKQ